MNEKVLNREIVLPTEIELNAIEKGNAYDIYKEDNFFDTDIEEARQEREHVERIISDLRGCGGWIEK